MHTRLRILVPASLCAVPLSNCERFLCDSDSTPELMKLLRVAADVLAKVILRPPPVAFVNVACTRLHSYSNVAAALPRNRETWEGLVLACSPEASAKGSL